MTPAKHRKYHNYWCVWTEEKYREFHFWWKWHGVVQLLAKHATRWQTLPETVSSDFFPPWSAAIYITNHSDVLVLTTLIDRPLKIKKKWSKTAWFNSRHWFEPMHYAIEVSKTVSTSIDSQERGPKNDYLCLKAQNFRGPPWGPWGFQKPYHCFNAI